ncbi:MAG: hypothetical protein GXO14_00400 [Thermococci archaeon]|nr:hypothetical protein [Thermococci archaeon]
MGDSGIDRLLQGIEEGGIVLIEAPGVMGDEVALELLRMYKGENRVVFITPKQKRMFRDNPDFSDVDIKVIGEDIHPQELYQITFAFRNLPDGSKVALLSLHFLLVFHPAELVYKLFSELTKISIDKNLLLIVTVDCRILDIKSLAMFEGLATHVLEILEVINGFRIRRGIRVKKSPTGGTCFYEITLSNGRIKVGEPIE